LLGAAEAGLYPGIIYYITLWFPQRQRVRVLGYFTLGSSLGNMVGSAINGFFLSLHGLLGLQGWQWVFLATGIPPVILTFVTLLALPETPRQARFLTEGEKETLLAAVARDAPAPSKHGNPLAVLVQPRIFVLGFFYTMVSMSIYGVSYWLPTVVKSFGVTSAQNGLLNMIPWLLASLVLLWLPGQLRSQSKVLRAVLIGAAIGIVCFAISTEAPTPALRFVALSIGAPCLYIMIPCFWSVPSRLLTGVQAAAGIAAINSLGNLGGFFGQNIMPWVQRATGSVSAPMIVPACCLLVLAIGAVIAWRVYGTERPIPQPDAAHAKG
jgi:MFS family permease